MASVCLRVINHPLFQNCLSNLKQKDWWKKQIGEMFEYSPYREDYVVALIMHGLSWSFSILIPMIGYQR